MEIRTYQVWLKGREDCPRVVHHTSAGKAKYEYLMDIGDLFPDGLPWADVRCRSLGPFRPDQHKDPDLERVKAYRTRPDLVLGATVEHSYDGKVGTIVGADGGYVAVLFSGLKYQQPVHPGELRVVGTAEAPIPADRAER